jgi:hypothetical protein
MALRKPLEIEYTNNLKQTIKPGDEILVITTGRGHGVSVAPGIYLGMTKEGDRGQCIVMMKLSRNTFRHKETNEEFRYEKHGTKLPRPKYPTFHYVAWNSGTSLTPQQIQENKDRNDKFDEEMAVYEADYKKCVDSFHYVSEPYERRSTLQRNRIYPINMPLKAFIDQI